MGMDPVQWAFFIVQIVGDFTKLGIFVWLISGGWKFVLRTIGFDIDTLLVSFIGRVYEYFMQVLSSDMFNEKVLSELMQNIYVFVGVIMFFRLMMLVIKYLVNPDLVNDAKIGVNSLIQRVVIGCCGILFIPTIFDFALQLQRHVMEDNLIQQIVVPKDMLNEVEKKVDKGGQYIGTYVLAGFISPGENASKKTINEYKDALENGDLSSLSTLRKDGFLGGEYEYDYFFLLSTFCLCYVLYLMVKYTLDVITRFFRMLMYQMLAPVAMIEYMINGSDNGVFKTWKQGVLGTYFMLFIRVLALWFVVFVMVLMTVKNDYNTESLLATDDYLLKALIIMALLGFMMDLPKLMGQVFGLDFEQEGNATGMLKQVGGMLKGAAMATVAAGGAAVGGAIGTAKAGFGMTSMGKKYNQGKADFAKNKPEMMGMLNSIKQGSRGVTSALMGATSVTGGFYKGYSGARDTQEGVAKERDSTVGSNKSKAKEEEKERIALERDERRFQQQMGAQQQSIDLQKENLVLNVTLQMDKNGIPTDVGSVAAQVKPTEVATEGARVSGEMSGAMTAALAASTLTPDQATTEVGGKLVLTPEAQGELTTTATQLVKTTYENAGIPVDDSVIERQVRQIVDTATPTMVDDHVEIKVNATAVGATMVGAQDEVITRVVNYVHSDSGSYDTSPIEKTVRYNEVRGSTITPEGRDGEIRLNEVRGSTISPEGRDGEIRLNEVRGTTISPEGRDGEIRLNEVRGSTISPEGRDGEIRLNEVRRSSTSSMESGEPSVPPHLDGDWDS